jgi:hypothetical protein
MSTKEMILKSASDPVEGKILSAQVLKASKSGIDPVINIKGSSKKIRLTRITEITKVTK